MTRKLNKRCAHISSLETLYSVCEHRQTVHCVEPMSIRCDSVRVRCCAHSLSLLRSLCECELLVSLCVVGCWHCHRYWTRYAGRFSLFSHIYSSYSIRTHCLLRITFLNSFCCSLVYTSRAFHCGHRCRVFLILFFDFNVHLYAFFYQEIEI